MVRMVCALLPLRVAVTVNVPVLAALVMDSIPVLALIDTPDLVVML